MSSRETPPALLAARDFDGEVGMADSVNHDAVDQEDAVHFCLLAEFDIDAGATLAHQYPFPTGTDEHRLAELMLPDGAHLRGEDWTIFYLGQTSSSAVAPMLSHESTSVDVPVNRRASTFPPSERPRRGAPGGGLLYVLNCVRMKEDKSVRRGAMVKAIAIATPNPFIGIYKPLLLLALEQYFQSPSYEILAKLFDSANAISTVGMPHLTRDEKILLRVSDRRDMFEVHFGVHDATNSAIAENEEDIEKPGPNHDYRSRTTSLSSTTAGSITGKGSSTSSQHPLTPDPIPFPRRGVPRDTHFFETEAKFGKVTVPIRIPMTVFDEDVGDYSIIELVQTFSQNIGPFQPPFHPYLHTNGANTHPVILILNAILAHKRVMFLGHGLPAHQVARTVLAASAMASGCGQVLRGITESAFPYANLASLDVLEEFSGFVAGVCNPRFEELPMTWDVLCNLETGKVTVSKELRPGPAGSLKSGRSSQTSLSFPAAKFDEEGIATPISKVTTISKADCVDNLFMEEIMAATTSHFGESHVRARFIDYLARFVRLAAYQESMHTGVTRIGYPVVAFRDGHLGSGVVFADDLARQRELSANGHRIDAWRRTKSYQLAQKDWMRNESRCTIKGFDVQHQISRLRLAKTMTGGEIQLILASFVREVRSYSQVVELLTYLPQYLGGLIPIANGLFHPWASVRNLALDLLSTIRRYSVGRHALFALNYFHRKTFIELCHQREIQLNMAPNFGSSDIRNDNLPVDNEIGSPATLPRQ